MCLTPAQPLTCSHPAARCVRIERLVARQGVAGLPGKRLLPPLPADLAALAAEAEGFGDRGCAGPARAHPKREGLGPSDRAAAPSAPANPFAGVRSPGPRGAAPPVAAKDFGEDALVGRSLDALVEAAEQPSTAPVASSPVSQASGAAPALPEQGAGEGAVGAGQSACAGTEQGMGDAALRRLPTFGAWEPGKPSGGIGAVAAAAAPACLEVNSAALPPGDAAAAAPAAHERAPEGGRSAVAAAAQGQGTANRACGHTAAPSGNAASGQRALVASGSGVDVPIIAAAATPEEAPCAGALRGAMGAGGVAGTSNPCVSPAADPEGTAQDAPSPPAQALASSSGGTRGTPPRGAPSSSSSLTTSSCSSSSSRSSSSSSSSGSSSSSSGGPASDADSPPRGRNLGADEAAALESKPAPSPFAVSGASSGSPPRGCDSGSEGAAAPTPGARQWRRSRSQVPVAGNVSPDGRAAKRACGTWGSGGPGSPARPALQQQPSIDEGEIVGAFAPAPARPRSRGRERSRERRPGADPGRSREDSEAPSERRGYADRCA